jgi:hypothetical protein
METNNVLYYTDGHQVTITDSGLKVRKTFYHLNGITRHRLAIIYPARIPFLILIGLGTCLFIAGAMNLIPASWSTYVNVFGFSLMVISLFMTGGVLLVFAGIFVMFRVREKYAVHIITAEGERNVVVSHSREYISQIMDALNRAFLDVMTPGKKEKIVSKTDRENQP